MPGSLDGIGLASRLLEEHPTIAVVVMSAYFDATKHVDERIPVLLKPFDAAAMANAIERSRNQVLACQRTWENTA
jgi:FixJ family two-component response regulator